MPAPKKPRKSQPIDDSSVQALAGPLGTLSDFFTAAQHSVSQHRKLINNTHALFLKCAKVTTTSEDGESIRLSGEKLFGDAWRCMAVHALGVKKGVDQADKVVKFMAGFIGFAVEYDSKQRAGTEEDDDQDDGPASRLVSQFLGFLLKGFLAKNKVARFRCVQLVALMINSLGEIDDDSYQQLKDALLERVRDKEAVVRMQAVVALSKLQQAEDEEDPAEEDEENVTAVLVDVMTHDPAGEVRRAALFNLIPSPASLPALILRTRDLDPINRRAAFTHVLSEVPCRTLSAPQREEVIGRGLRDREEAVSKAAKRLVAKWAEEVGGLIEFLQLFDLAESTVAEKAVEAIFELKSEWLDAIEFDDDFYRQLTPFTAFLARCYFNYLRATEDPRLADLEPVVTALAFFVQAEWAQLSARLDGPERDEQKELVHEFIVGELVGMAVNLDYGDEIGRRKMFELMREMLQHHALPESLIPKCLDVLMKGTDERDFTRIVPEIVQVLRQNSGLLSSDEEAVFDEDLEDDEGNPIERPTRAPPKTPGGRPRPSKQSAEGERRIKQLNLRCLAVVRATLERTTGALREASMLNGLVSELIVPAVKTKDPQVRAEGLVCLGLCSLLDKEMALNSFDLLARQSQVAEGELGVRLHQTVFDILVLYGIRFGEGVEEEDEDGRVTTRDRFGGGMILGLIMNCLEAEEPDVLATSVVGIAKLMLSGMVTDEEILTRLVLLYFASETADNQELRQCLSYFFPVYCYSNPTNQRRLASVALSALGLLKGVYDDLEHKAVMTAPLQIGAQLLDWADPQKAVTTEFAKPDETIHFDLATEMVQRLLREEEKDERKLLCQLLPKLYIPDEVDDYKLKALLILIDAIKQHRPLADAVSKNALNKFEAGLVKTFGERVDALDAAEAKASAAVSEMQAYITSVLKDTYGDESSEEEGSEGSEELELDDEEEEEEGKGGGTDEEEVVRKQAPRSVRKPRGGTREPSTEEEEEEEEEESEEEAPPPPRKASGRGKKGRKEPSTEEEEEESEEESD